MKVKREDVETLQGWVAPYDTDRARDGYRRGDFPQADKVRDLDKRYRWDLFWCIWRNVDGVKAWRSRLGDEGVNDEHLDTALRRVVDPLGVR